MRVRDDTPHTTADSKPPKPTPLRLSNQSASTRCSQVLISAISSMDTWWTIG